MNFNGKPPELKALLIRQSQNKTNVKLLIIMVVVVEKLNPLH